MKKLGLVGLGAFGRLIVKHMTPYADIVAFDPSPQAEAFARQNGIAFGTLAEVAQADYVVIATPVEKIRDAVRALRPHLRPGTVVMDVASVKVLPARILQEELPADVDVVCTHPLFGPQSAKDGLAGLRVVVCPLRGDHADKVTAFLSSTLDLKVIVTTPEEHDREMAAVQGLTHMIAKVMVEMEPLPQKLTTRSFDLLMQVVEMVRYDSPELFLAIQRDNPFSADVRSKFFAKADALRDYLDSSDAQS